MLNRNIRTASKTHPVITKHIYRSRSLNISMNMLLKRKKRQHPPQPTKATLCEKHAQEQVCKIKAALSYSEIVCLSYCQARISPWLCDVFCVCMYDPACRGVRLEELT